MADALEQTTSLARAFAPRRFGVLVGQTRWDIIERRPTRLRGQVKSWTSYAVAVNTGTGIYGPRGMPITPKKGKFLVFPGRDGKLVFARSVKGMRARPYLVRALRVASAGSPGWTVRYHPLR